MDVSRYQHEHSVTIACSPEALYDLVSDITGMGRISPACVAGDWDAPAVGCASGAWFTGHNKVGEREWSTRCQVEAAERGKEFRFVNHGPDGGVGLVEWGYRFEPDGDGAKVTESWRVLPPYPEFVKARFPDADVEERLAMVAENSRKGIAATLAKLKEVAEA